MFSIVIPLYNKAKSIANTIQSILGQSFADFELIIVDDGSTDDSVAIVQQFTDQRIRLIQKDNGGVSSARNRGINDANYDFIALLDADQRVIDPEGASGPVDVFLHQLDAAER